MLASLADAPLDDASLVYEPKYDGIRAVAEIEPRGPARGRASRDRDARPGVRLWSRLGNEKTAQFPEIAAALEHWAAAKLDAPAVLDGEIVALDVNGEPTGFQQLQGRVHLSEQPGAAASGRPTVAFIAFDLLRHGRVDFRDRPLLERRAALEQLFGDTGSPVLRMSVMARGNGRALYKEALEHGWEGLIAKHAGSLYKSGKRTPDWRKLKIVNEQEFVIGGWTEPRHTRSYFGALLLGVYEADGSLAYAGHTGTGFNERELARVMQRLKPLATSTSPFRERPKTNERPHWARPELVAQIKFTEWTADGKLRHPVYLGLRDDKRPTEVRRERKARVQASALGPRGVAEAASRPSRASSASSAEGGADLIDQLRTLERARRDGVLVLPDGDKLAVTNLSKVFWPRRKLTKGDLFRYYVRVAPVLLPVLADRPLVMKRYPNGIEGKPFYQHRAADVPPGVRTEMVEVAERRPHIVGGSLKTLLYTTQLAAISQDPWFSRVPQPKFADFAAFDLDPSDGVPFARVLDVARWIRNELQSLGADGAAKTSGASGLHVYVALPPRTPYDAGLLFCQIVATMVVQKHPRVATVERSVAARGKRVYIDCLQNILGKTLASAYSARASEHAGVSTPLAWSEIDEGVDPRALTIETVPDRIAERGDIWAELRASKGIDLERATRTLRRR
jgi:bifunctional non-homologous end joining protein LigD